MTEELFLLPGAWIMLRLEYREEPASIAGLCKEKVMAEIGRLQSFINITSAPEAGEHHAIKLGGDGGLKLTGRTGSFFTFASTHRDTIRDFIGAVREQYGDHIADLTFFCVRKIRRGKLFCPSLKP